MSASQLRAPEQLRVQTAEKAVNSFDGDKAERSFRVLAWFGRIVSFAGQSIAAVLVALAIYVVIRPALTAPFAPAIGVFTLLLIAACAWLIGRVAAYVSEK
jgi:hypothetical protein